MSDVRNEIRTPGYKLVNLRGSYAWQKVRIDFGVENLLDKLYFLPTGGAYTGQGTSMSITGVPWGIAVPGMGRNAYVATNFKFDAHAALSNLLRRPGPHPAAGRYRHRFLSRAMDHEYPFYCRRIDPADAHPLGARGVAAHQADRGFGHAQLSGEKRDQASVSLAIHRRRRKPNLQRLAMSTDHFGLLCPRLDMQSQRHSLAVGDQPGHDLTPGRLKADPPGTCERGEPWSPFLLEKGLGVK